MPKNQLKDIKKPIISTPPPGPKAAKLLELQRHLESSAVSYPGLLPLVPARASREWIEDVDGNVFLDLASMAGVTTLGHSPSYLREFKKAAGKIMTSLDYPTVPRLAFLQSLHDLLYDLFGERMKIHLTAPTGANAVEAALKLCRWKTKASTIIAFTGGYHGMSAGAAAVSNLPDGPRLTLKPSIPTAFVPFPYCYRCPVGLERQTCNLACFNLIEQTIVAAESRGEKLAGAIIEPIQGEGGTVVAPVEYLKELQRLLARRGALLIVDEVQCGFGRTGCVFAWERTGFAPDILVFSKAASGVGAPMAGIAFKESLDGWPRGSHIGTFRGFVPAFASGVAALNHLTQSDILEQVRRTGKEMESFLKENLAAARHCGDIRAEGYMFGIELVRDTSTREPDPGTAKEVAQNLFQKGIIVELGGRYDNVIRMLPPLIINLETLRYGMEMIASVIKAA